MFGHGSIWVGRLRLVFLGRPAAPLPNPRKPIFMSQINEALNRPADIQVKGPSGDSPPLLAAGSRPRRPVANWIWPVAIVLFLALAAGLYVAVFQGGHVVKDTPASLVAAPAPAVKSVTAPAPPAPVPVVETKPAKTTRVQGIVFVPANPYAIINGRTVFVGDVVDGLAVAAISADAVTLVGNGRTNQFHVGY